MKSCLHFLSYCCCQNYKTDKCREILHFQKHSRLHNQFWKAAMFFIFVFFHFLCKVIILTSLLSMNKHKILKISLWDYLVNDSYTCSFVLYECKFCNEICIIMYFNGSFNILFHFFSHEIFYFDPCWHSKSCLRVLAVLSYLLLMSRSPRDQKRRWPEVEWQWR